MQPVAPTPSYSARESVTPGPGKARLELGNAGLENRAQMNAVFRAAAMRELTVAQGHKAARRLWPERIIAQQAAIDDDGARATALANIKKELPTIFKSVSARSGELVTAFEDIIGTALLSGATQGRKRAG